MLGAMPAYRDPYPFMYAVYHALRSHLRGDLTLYPEFLSPFLAEGCRELGNVELDYSADMTPVEGVLGDNVQEKIIKFYDDDDDDGREEDEEPSSRQEITSLGLDIPCRCVIVLEDSRGASPDAEARKLLFEVSTSYEYLDLQALRLEKTRKDYGASFAWLLLFKPSNVSAAPEPSLNHQRFPHVRVLTVNFDNDSNGKKKFSSLI
jgi:hypothetical protein